MFWSLNQRGESQQRRVCFHSSTTPSLLPAYGACECQSDTLTVQRFVRGWTVLVEEGRGCSRQWLVALSSSSYAAQTSHTTCGARHNRSDVERKARLAVGVWRAVISSKIRPKTPEKMYTCTRYVCTRYALYHTWYAVAGMLAYFVLHCCCTRYHLFSLCESGK